MSGPDRLQWTVVAALCVAMIAFACVAGDPPGSKAKPIPSYLQVWTDPNNGCEYLAIRYDSGLVPRRDRAGNHMGCTS